MGQLLLVLVVALVVGGIAFGVAVLVTGTDRGLGEVEPDGRALPLPTDRPLVEGDLARVRFDTALRGYRMAQVDQALRRAAYDIGYKDELISVLEAEVVALRAGRVEDAEVLRRAREAALVGSVPVAEEPVAAEPVAEDPVAAEPVAEDPVAEPAEAVADSAEPTGELGEPATGPSEPAGTATDERGRAGAEPDTDADSDVDARPAAEPATGGDAGAAVVDARSGRP